MQAHNPKTTVLFQHHHTMDLTTYITLDILTATVVSFLTGQLT